MEEDKQFTFIYMDGGTMYPWAEYRDTIDEVWEVLNDDPEYQDVKAYIIEGHDLKLYDRT